MWEVDPGAKWCSLELRTATPPARTLAATLVLEDSPVRGNRIYGMPAMTSGSQHHSMARKHSKASSLADWKLDSCSPPFTDRSTPMAEKSLELGDALTLSRFGEAPSATAHEKAPFNTGLWMGIGGSEVHIL